MELKTAFSIRNLVIITILVFIVLALRSWLVPFCHDEVATFYFYIQRGEYIPYFSTPDANNHVLNSFTSYFSFKIFGDSPLALRLPSLFSFLVLVWAVFKLSKHISKLHAKIFLFGSFLLSYHFLTFYGLCRGYGMSMSFYVLAFAFLFDYFKSRNLFSFACTIFSMQLAISANMTLMVPSLFITGMMFLFHFFQKDSRKWWIFPAYIIHLGIIFCWAKYSMFLQESGALYYGQGDSYWQVTFETLIDLIYHSSNMIVLIGVATLFVISWLISVYKNYKNDLWENVKSMQPFIFFTIMFPVLIIGFYVLHVWKGVNFPEDRTALFYYPVAILMVVFLLDQFSSVREEFYSRIIIVLFAIHFIVGFNLNIQSIPEYETVPEKFYVRLLEEQKSSKEKFTISGHRVFELMFSFLNYRNGSPLNFAGDGEEINLYADYAIAKQSWQSRFEDDYEIIDKAEWDFVLLKRKERLATTLKWEVKSDLWREGNDEFFEFFRAGDTIKLHNSPLKIEFDFDIDHAAQPFNGWLVVDIIDEAGKLNIYKRLPLNWIKFSLNQTKNNSFSLLTPELPKKIKSMVVYLWNGEKQFIKIKMNSVKIFQFKKEK